jgi:hypothetical protein
MPLDSPEHVRAAWHLVTALAFRRRKALEDGRDLAAAMLPEQSEIDMAMDAILAAAEEHGVALIPELGPGEEPGPPG